MIEMNNMSINLSASIEQIPVSQDMLVTEELNDTNELALDEELSIDPDSFMILMAQVITNNLNQPEVNEATSKNTESLDGIQENKVEVSVKGQSINEPLIAADSKSEDSENILDFQPELNTNIENVEINLEDNIALTWINSASYKSLKTSSQPNKVEQQSIEVPENNLIDQKSIKYELYQTDIAPTKDLPIEITENNLSISVAEEVLLQIQPSDFDTYLILPEKPLEEMDTETKLDQIPFDKIPQVTISNLNAKPSMQNAIVQAKSFEIPVHIESSQWADKFSENIVWLGQQNIKSALIKVHPEDLGPIEINIKVVKDTASVAICSHSEHVRDIVEAALPKLRDMMAEQGLYLSETSISSDSTNQQRSQQNNHPQQSQNLELENETILTPLKKRPTNGLIDYFA